MLSDCCLSRLSVCLYRWCIVAKTVGRIKMKLGKMVGLGSGHIVLDGDRAPHSKNRHTPNFRPMSIVAKRRGIKMPLSRPTEVGLGPGHIVLDRNPAPPSDRGTSARPRLFGPCLLWPHCLPPQPRQNLWITWFTYKMFAVARPNRPRNDRMYAHETIRKKDVAAKCLCTRSDIRLWRQLTIWLGVVVNVTSLLLQ